jgi:hypothetical protein
MKLKHVPEEQVTSTLVPCLAYSSTLKMKAAYSSETSVDFHWTTRIYVPEDITLHNHRCENLNTKYIIFSTLLLLPRR